MKDAWEKLIERYANGRPICNCGCAYYTKCGSGIDETGKRRTDMLACENGCQGNQYAVRYEIARKVLAELSK